MREWVGRCLRWDNENGWVGVRKLAWEYVGRSLRKRMRMARYVCEKLE
jgi:hypothetical protein